MTSRSIQEGASVESIDIWSNKDEQLVPPKVKESYYGRMKRVKEAEKKAFKALQDAMEEISATRYEVENERNQEKVSERENAEEREKAVEREEAAERVKAAEEAAKAIEEARAEEGDPLYLSRETLKASIKLYFRVVRNKRDDSYINFVNCILRVYFRKWIKDLSWYREDRQFPPDYEDDREAYDVVNYAKKIMFNSAKSYFYASQNYGDYKKIAASHEKVVSCLKWGLQNICNYDPKRPLETDESDDDN